MLLFGYPVLVAFILFTILRLLLPFKFFFSKSISFNETLSKGFQFFTKEHNGVSFWNIICIIWIVGICADLFHYVYSRHKLRTHIETYGKNVSDKIVELLPSSYHTKNTCFYSLNHINGSIIFGLFKTYVVIPENHNFSDAQLKSILQHELSHKFHHDLFIKFAVDIFCIIYWWNPFMHILSLQTDTLLEIHTDQYLIENSSQEEVLTYLETLRLAATGEKKSTEVNSSSPLSLGFLKDSASCLSIRTTFIKDYLQKKNSRSYILPVFYIFLLFIFSYIFIFEPHYASPYNIKNTYVGDPHDSYVLIKTNGTYEIYMDGEFIFSTDTWNTSYEGMTVRYEDH